MSAPAYSPDPDCFDEAYTAEGEPRPHYGALLEALGEQDLKGLRERVEAKVERSGLTFGPDEPIPVDPDVVRCTVSEAQRADGRCEPDAVRRLRLLGRGLRRLVES